MFFALLLGLFVSHRRIPPEILYAEINQMIIILHFGFDKSISKINLKDIYFYIFCFFALLDIM